MGDGERRAALGVGVYLGQNNHIDPDLLLEGTRLLDGVVAGQRISDENGEMRLDHALDLLHLVHEVGVGLHAPGGIDQYHVPLAGLGMLQSIVGYGRRIAPGLVLDDLAAQAVRMNGDLLDGPGPEGVGGGKDHGEALALQTLGQLGDGSGLTSSINSKEHHDDRLLVARR